MAKKQRLTKRQLQAQRRRHLRVMIAYTHKLLRKLLSEHQKGVARLVSLNLKDRLLTIKEKGFKAGSIVSWPAKGPAHVTGTVVEIDRGTRATSWSTTPSIRPSRASADGLNTLRSCA